MQGPRAGNTRGLVLPVDVRHKSIQDQSMPRCAGAAKVLVAHSLDRRGTAEGGYQGTGSEVQAGPAGQPLAAPQQLLQGSVLLGQLLSWLPAWPLQLQLLRLCTISVLSGDFAHTSCPP